MKLINVSPANSIIRSDNAKNQVTLIRTLIHPCNLKAVRDLCLQQGVDDGYSTTYKGTKHI